MRIRKILAVLFLTGVLVIGLGCGITFAEWSSFQYAGEKLITLGEERETTYVYDVPEDGEMAFFSYANDKVTVAERSYLEDEIVVEVKDYGNTTVELDDGDLYLWNSSGTEDEIRVLFQCKDELLEDLKKKSFHSYRLESVKQINIFVPAGMKDVIQVN